MKAVIYTEYGSPEVLQIKEVAKPAPKDNEVLIHIHATPVNFGDLLARNFKSVTPRQFNMPLLFWLRAKSRVHRVKHLLLASLVRKRLVQTA